ncbi:cupin domain-containing protein [Bradyrhizobium cenepequi]|uniref:cupin domain-containing protein n=1 Tax=Bradyrhizobium cenepequi TaxID=2821403 RepID=UPI001CE39108|nr:cupin domain-containing protein [Bradyrhizobium cenepequi]MCA6111165.1 cupin domain-containing protein [Bradyrhizobium cenepequi]
MEDALKRHGGRRAHKENGVTWYDAAVGERIAVRVSSLDTNGAYAVVESIADPGCGVPLHLHQNEEEHFVVIAGIYRFACENKLFDATAGTSVTIPKGARHAWRNLSGSTGRLLAVFTPGGFERLIQEVIDIPAGKVEEVAARYGCLIVGPPIEA